MMKICKRFFYTLLVLIPVLLLFTSIGKNLIPVKNFKIETEYDVEKLDPEYAHVVAAEGIKTGSVWIVSVTVLHNDTGPDHYADCLQIIDPESGKVLAGKILLKPHIDEQPFKESLENVKFPADQKAVIIRAGCSVQGFGGQEIMVFLVQDEVTYKILNTETDEEN